MKAMTQNAYGSADVLRLEDIPMPQPGDDEVLIRVHAAGVGPEVWHVMRGLPYLVRLMGYGVRRPKVSTPGRDVAGVVEAVGKDVVDVRPGDEVFGTCRGSLAEYALATTATIAPMPTNIGFAAAAALPTSGCTALHGLRDAGRIEAGQTVVVIGASGGVGTHAVQVAKAYGAHVTGVCSGAKAALVESLGVDNIIDYTRQDLTDGRHRFDLILDTAGRRSVSSLRGALNRNGTLVIVGGEGGGRMTGGIFQRQLMATAVSPFVRQRLCSLMSKESRDDLLDLKKLVEGGSLRPVVDRTYQLEDVAEALRDDDEGHGRGKKVAVIVPS